MGQNLMDEIDSGNFFDQIDDLIEFPPDSDCGIGGDFVDAPNSEDFPSMWSNPFPESDPLFSGDGPSDFSTELSVPYEDIVQLEWLSTFVEDSFSGGGLTIGKDSLSPKNNNGPPQKQFETSSPISVLESSTSSSTSSSSCSAEKTMPPSPNPHRGLQKARSKRARPTTFSTRPAIQLVPNALQPESKNFAESDSGLAHPKQKKKIRAGPPADGDQGPVRKCMHCEITKTPQWRAGPMGPKTLCNACGVRYKSGRLFPEYRPAASPTFVPALHSNSHKKVLEMRCKDGPMPEEAIPPRASKPKNDRSP